MEKPLNESLSKGAELAGALRASAAEGYFKIYNNDGVDAVVRAEEPKSPELPIFLATCIRFAREDAITTGAIIDFAAERGHRRPDELRPISS